MLAVVLFAPLATSTQHSGEHLCNLIAPENEIYIPRGLKSAGGINEAEFNKVIDETEELYTEFIKEQYGGTLQIERKWDDGTVNAYAQRLGKVYKVSMFGGLARHPEATSDGFRAVLCHEIGHHIGGAPKRTSWWGGAMWASNEGQSDYYATSKCLKKYFETDLQETVKRYNKASTKEQLFAKAECDKIFNNVDEAAMCYRASEAGKSLARLLGSLRNNADVKYDTPDPAVVSSTDHNHPKAQCRLDTYFQGALCDKDYTLLPSATDATTGYCVRKDNYYTGVRPLCWYKP